jgi:D-glycero-D-manno-heptose 1,7-bisphosphate phosphatase
LITMPEPEQGTQRRGRPAVFLDRDGTIIVDHGYLAEPAGVTLLPGAIEGLRRLHQAGYVLVVVTNQSGIARGLYGVEDYRAVEARLEERLAAAHIPIAGAYFCPHHPDISGPCDCRKPGLGLYRRAAAELNLDLARSVLVGDRTRDVEAATALGAAAWLVGSRPGADGDDAPPAGIPVVRDLAQLAERLLGP